VQLVAVVEAGLESALAFFENATDIQISHRAFVIETGGNRVDLINPPDEVIVLPRKNAQEQDAGVWQLAANCRDTLIPSAISSSLPALKSPYRLFVPIFKTTALGLSPSSNPFSIR
jgi:hypothetical protein